MSDESKIEPALSEVADKVEDAFRKAIEHSERWPQSQKPDPPKRPPREV